MTTGSSKTSPNASVNLRMKSIELEIEIIGLQPVLLAEVHQELHRERDHARRWRTRRRAGRAASRSRTNGAAYFFSWLCRPGATNAHTCQRMAGMAMKSPSDHRDLHVGPEGLRRSGEDGLDLDDVLDEVLHDALGEEQRDHQPDAGPDQAPHDAGAELAQVVQERHLPEAVVFLGLGRLCHLFVGHHHSVRKCRSWPTPRPAWKPSAIACVTYALASRIASGERLAPRQPRRDGGGEGAAGAVGVRRVDARRREGP